MEAGGEDRRQSSGLLHEEREDHREEGGGAAQGRLLSYSGDDEQSGEGDNISYMSSSRLVLQVKVELRPLSG